MASKGPRSKLDHDTRARRQKVILHYCQFIDIFLSCRVAVTWLQGLLSCLILATNHISTLFLIPAMVNGVVMLWSGTPYFVHFSIYSMFPNVRACYGCT